MTVSGLRCRPPLSFYSRKPVIVLPRLHKKKERQKTEDAEKRQVSDETAHEDALDQHVEDVLRKRDKFRRVMQGVWSFVKTPLGVCMLLLHLQTLCIDTTHSSSPLYTGSLLVRLVAQIIRYSALDVALVFWGTGIVFFLAKFINLHNDIQQSYWVELCQQVETGV